MLERRKRGQERKKGKDNCKSAKGISQIKDFTFEVNYARIIKAVKGNTGFPFRSWNASVAQWIEQCPPEACAAVRLRSDAFIYGKGAVFVTAPFCVCDEPESGFTLVPLSAAYNPGMCLWVLSGIDAVVHMDIIYNRLIFLFIM